MVIPRACRSKVMKHRDFAHSDKLGEARAGRILQRFRPRLAIFLIRVYFEGGHELGLVFASNSQGRHTIEDFWFPVWAIKNGTKIEALPSEIQSFGN